MSWTFFIFVWCSCIQPVLMQTTSWDLVTSPAVFGKPVELRCTVVGASCCSQLTRIWNRDLIDILNNGITNFPSKYRETLDAPNKQFSLIIYNLTKDDVDVVYTCTYGNISPRKTLTQNDSFEYHPTEISCPVKIHNGELVGTLSVAMVAPYPSVFAQYGDSNFTSYLTTNITPVAGSTKFYTINSSLKGNATCRNNENFTLSVLTGVTTTNICDDVTLCTVIHYGECGKCAGFCCLYSTVGTVIFFIILIGILLLYPHVKRILSQHLDLHTGFSVAGEITRKRKAKYLQTVKEDNAELGAICGSPAVLDNSIADENFSSLHLLLKTYFVEMTPVKTKIMQDQSAEQLKGDRKEKDGKAKLRKSKHGNRNSRSGEEIEDLESHLADVGGTNSDDSSEESDGDLLALQQKLLAVKKQRKEVKKQREKERLLKEIKEQEKELKKEMEKKEGRFFSRKATIIAASIPKYVTGIRDCTVQAFPGAMIGRLTVLINRGVIKLDNIDIVLVHIGTNNIESHNLEQIYLIMGICYTQLRARQLPKLLLLLFYRG